MSIVEGPKNGYEMSVDTLVQWQKVQVFRSGKDGYTPRMQAGLVSEILKDEAKQVTIQTDSRAEDGKKDIVAASIDQVKKWNTPLVEGVVIIHSEEGVRRRVMAVQDNYVYTTAEEDDPTKRRPYPMKFPYNDVMSDESWKVAPKAEEKIVGDELFKFGQKVVVYDKWTQPGKVVRRDNWEVMRVSGNIVNVVTPSDAVAMRKRETVIGKVVDAAVLKKWQKEPTLGDLYKRGAALYRVASVEERDVKRIRFTREENIPDELALAMKRTVLVFMDDFMKDDNWTAVI